MRSQAGCCNAQAASRGDLLLAGALADPVDGAVFAFSGGQAAAESFATKDPYVLEGIVTSWVVREWTTVVGSIHEDLPEAPEPTPFRLDPIPSRQSIAGKRHPQITDHL